MLTRIRLLDGVRNWFLDDLWDDLVDGNLDAMLDVIVTRVWLGDRYSDVLRHGHRHWMWNVHRVALEDRHVNRPSRLRVSRVETFLAGVFHDLVDLRVAVSLDGDERDGEQR